MSDASRLCIERFYLFVCGEAAKVIFIIADGRNGLYFFSGYIETTTIYNISTEAGSNSFLWPIFFDDKSEQLWNSSRNVVHRIFAFCYFYDCVGWPQWKTTNVSPSRKLEHINRNRLQWIPSHCCSLLLPSSMWPTLEYTLTWWQCNKQRRMITIYNYSHTHTFVRGKLFHFKSIIRSFCVCVCLCIEWNMKLVVINIPIDIE